MLAGGDVGGVAGRAVLGGDQEVVGVVPAEEEKADHRAVGGVGGEPVGGGGVDEAQVAHGREQRRRGHAGARRTQEFPPRLLLLLGGEGFSHGGPEEIWDLNLRSLRLTSGWRIGETRRRDKPRPAPAGPCRTSSACTS